MWMCTPLASFFHKPSGGSLCVCTWQNAKTGKQKRIGRWDLTIVWGRFDRRYRSFGNIFMTKVTTNLHGTFDTVKGGDQIYQGIEA